VAPRGRSYAEWKKESVDHGWPSFRDQEVVHKNMQVEAGGFGELISNCNTHLGHNIPDGKGNRHCVNLMCMAGIKAGNETASDLRVDATTDHSAQQGESATAKQETSHGGSGGSGKLPSSYDPSGTTGQASSERPPASAATSSASSKMHINLNIAGVSSLLASASAILQAATV